MKIQKITSLFFLSISLTFIACGDGGDSEPVKVGNCDSKNPNICGPKRFCDFTDFSCGAQGGHGECQDITEVCAEIYSPVCGCDGKTYGNACEAKGQGQSIVKIGEC